MLHRIRYSIKSERLKLYVVPTGRTQGRVGSGVDVFCSGGQVNQDQGGQLYPVSDKQEAGQAIEEVGT